MLCGCFARLLFSLRAMQSRPHHRRKVGETIRTYRKQRGLTQEKLAEKADLHHNFIGEVERGNMEISLGSLLKIAKALGVKVRDLVAGL
jgi:transcriptional regulator with XRE-family HTH domain